MERLTPLADAFLEAEDADHNASLVIGSMAVFAGPAPDFEDFRSMVESRLPLIPRYRQKVCPSTFDLAAPAWVDDPDFDLGWHLRSTALPSPGGDAEIGRLMGRVMSRRMDRSRPLWEYWFVEGLEDGRWALLSKLHHCMVDGVSGTDLYRLVLDQPDQPDHPDQPDQPDHHPDQAGSADQAEHLLEAGLPDPASEPAVEPWHPAATPSRLSIAARTALALALTPVPVIRAIGSAVQVPGRTARSVLGIARGLLTMSEALRPLQSTSLTGPLGGSLRYAWTSVSLDEIRTVRKALGGTVNDVALSAVTGGFRELLLSRNETPGPHALRSLVPVSTRAPGTESELGNRVSLMLPYLPVDVADAGSRLTTVIERLRARREGAEPLAGDGLTSAAELGPYPTVVLGIRAGLRLPQHQIATVTTNVPGPQVAFHALGRELQEILPYVPIADRVRIGVAIFSYCGTVVFGVTADYDAVPDVEVLVDGISRSMAELSELARRVGSA